MTIQRNELIPVWTRGDRLRKARQTLGLSTKDFAELIGVSQKTVNNAEGDAHDVRKIVMNAWSMATGVPAEWLETGAAPAGPDGGGEAEGRVARLTEAKQRRARRTRATDGYALDLASAA